MTSCLDHVDSITSPLSSHFIDFFPFVYFQCLFFTYPKFPIFLKKFLLNLITYDFVFHTTQKQASEQSQNLLNQTTARMSFLTEVSARRVATLSRTRFTTLPRATFTTSVYLRKSIVDAGKDALKTADRAVSDKIVDGIDVGGMSKTSSSSVFKAPVLVIKTQN